MAVGGGGSGSVRTIRPTHQQCSMRAQTGEGHGSGGGGGSGSRSRVKRGHTKDGAIAVARRSANPADFSV